GNFPQASRPILTGAGQGLSVRRERNVPNPPCVTEKRSYLPGLQVANADRSIAAAASQEGIQRRKAYGVSRSSESEQSGYRPAIVGITEQDLADLVAQAERVTAVRKGDCTNADCFLAGLELEVPTRNGPERLAGSRKKGWVRKGRDVPHLRCIVW